MAKSSGALTTRRVTATRRTRMSRKMGGKPAKRALIIGGLAAGGLAVVAAILLLKNKSASAQPAQPNPQPKTTPLTPLQNAAVDMNHAIDVNGYVAADAGAGGAYRNFQQAAGLKADGWPGQGTYKALVAALASTSPPTPPSSKLNPAYTFAPFNSQTGSGGFNGSTAPTPEQWFGPSAAGKPASYTG